MVIFIRLPFDKSALASPSARSSLVSLSARPPKAKRISIGGRMRCSSFRCRIGQNSIVGSTYVDGSAEFARPVPPCCVECHATYFQPISSSPSENHYNKDNIVLGISCERCHGPGMEHVQNHSAKSTNSTGKKPMPPLRLSRDRQIDVCAQCHGGG